MTFPLDSPRRSESMARRPSSARGASAVRPSPMERGRASRNRKSFDAPRSCHLCAFRRRKNQGVESPQQRGGLAMRFHESAVLATPPHLVQLDRLGDEIAELSAHLDAATARLLALIRDFDARGGWNTGFRSCAAWLSWRVGLDLGAARERVRVARCLGTLPLLADALARGELSYAKVRALTRVATPESEARLLAVGRAGTAAHVERIVRGWRRVDRLAEAREAAHQHAARGLHLYQDEDGTVVVHGISGHALRRAPNPRPSPRPVHSSR